MTSEILMRFISIKISNPGGFSRNFSLDKQQFWVFDFVLSLCFSRLFVSSILLQSPSLSCLSISTPPPIPQTISKSSHSYACSFSLLHPPPLHICPPIPSWHYLNVKEVYRCKYTWSKRFSTSSMHTKNSKTAIVI